MCICGVERTWRWHQPLLQRASELGSRHRQRPGSELRNIAAIRLNSNAFPQKMPHQSVVSTDHIGHFEFEWFECFVEEQTQWFQGLCFWMIQVLGVLCVLQQVGNRSWQFGHCKSDNSFREIYCETDYFVAQKWREVARWKDPARRRVLSASFSCLFPGESSARPDNRTRFPAKATWQLEWLHRAVGHSRSAADRIRWREVGLPAIGRVGRRTSGCRIGNRGRLHADSRTRKGTGNTWLFVRRIAVKY